MYRKHAPLEPRSICCGVVTTIGFVLFFFAIDGFDFICGGIFCFGSCVVDVTAVGEEMFLGLSIFWKIFFHMH